jgi:hypothetical protein
MKPPLPKIITYLAHNRRFSESGQNEKYKLDQICPQEETAEKKLKLAYIKFRIRKPA